MSDPILSPIIDAFKSITKLANDSDEQLFQLILKVAESLKELTVRTVDHARASAARIDVLEQRIAALEEVIANIIDVNGHVKH